MNATAKELVLFIDNDGDLHRQQHVPIRKNLMTKHAQGKYNRALAVKLFMYLVDNGAKKYMKMHGSSDTPWNKVFTKPVRTKAAEMLRDQFEDEAKDGEWDEYIPAKYKGKVSGKTLGESEDGALFDGRTRKALAEAAGDGMAKMSPKLGKQMDLLRDTASSLKLAAKHEDDTQALQDFGMMVGVLARALSEFGWKAETRPMAALSQKLMQAAKDQGIGDR